MHPFLKKRKSGHGSTRKKIRGAGTSPIQKKCTILVAGKVKKSSAWYPDVGYLVRHRAGFVLIKTLDKM